MGCARIWAMKPQRVRGFLYAVYDSIRSFAVKIMFLAGIQHSTLGVLAYTVHVASAYYLPYLLHVHIISLYQFDQQRRCGVLGYNIGTGAYNSMFTYLATSCLILWLIVSYTMYVRGVVDVRVYLVKMIRT